MKSGGESTNKGFYFAVFEFLNKQITKFVSHFAAPHHIDPARSVGFSTKQRRTPAVAAARMDWVMSPSSGDALLCFVKRTVPAGSKGTNWYRQDYTQHKVVVPGASRCLAKVAHQTGGYPQKVDCQPQP
ncbi:hypothetical protein LZO81_003561 [Escherichia coli]|nr:hypothetical protein [Escherichia coli]